MTTIANMTKLNLHQLNNEERNKILNVLERYYTTQEAKRDRIRQLRERLKILKDKGVIRSHEKPGIRVCSRCRRKLGMFFNTGAICNRCERRVCQSCCQEPRSDVGARYIICNVCSIERQLAIESGSWTRRGSVDRETDPDSTVKMLSKFLKRIDSYAEDKDEIHDEGKIEDMNESEEVNGIMYNGEDENDDESNNEINNDSRTWQKQDGNLDDLITRSTSFSHNKNDYIRDSFREKSKPLTSARSRRGQMMSKQRVSSTNDSVFSDSFASMDSNCSTGFCRDESSEGFYSSIDHDGKCDSPHSHALPSNGGAIKRIASAGERSDLSSFKANRHSFAASSLKNRTDLRRKALLRERYHEGNFSCDDTESPMGSFDSDYAVESRDEDATTTQNVLLRNKNVVVSQMLEDATGVFQKVSIRRNERLENIKEPEFRKSTEKSDEEDIETYFQKYATPQQRRHLQLTRQNSFDSDNGCGIESEEVEIKGEILFGLRYNRKNSTLEIDVDRARDLPVISKKHKCNAYIKTYFVPETGKNSKRRTTVKKGTTNPQYNETLKYKISSDDEISKKILVISIWHQDKYVPKKQFLGEVRVPMSSLPLLDQQLPRWHKLKNRE